ncbi:MAG: hypothetical protein PHC28_16230, partial [Flavobacterium sp.]|nr:hypothetical protein [Flavobacterium sp.]
MYDYGARNYMPDLGRWGNVDPLTEKYSTWTPYAFSGNRVIDSRELEGLEPIKPPTPTQLAEVQIRLGTTNCANERLGGLSAPYTPNHATKIYEGGSEPYVRVYTENITAPDRSWMMKPEDIEGLSPAEIQAKFALPNEPTHIVDVNAEGATIEVGPVNENFGFTPPEGT